MAAFLAVFLVVCGIPVLFPGIDLWASALFWRPGAGFFLAQSLPFHVVRAAMPFLVAVLVVAGLALLLAASLGRPWRGVTVSAAAFLLVSLALGPGIVVNTVFKDHWGRARPSQIAAFGGDRVFTPAFVPSDQCARNCSFPAGDPAMGFYLVSGAFLIAAPRRRRLAIGGALALGAGIGLVRIAQGGHFLSDVLASGFLVYGTSWLLHRWIVQGDGLARLWREIRAPSPEFRRWLLAGLLASLSIAVAIAWLDRPLADLFRGLDPVPHRVFRVITAFGVSTFYLIAAALVMIVCFLARRRAGDAIRRQHLALWASRAGFVLVCVGGAGLVGDILKPVFGRMRPALWVSQGAFGFTWHGAHADHWSFPSGHSITIVALAGALARIEPRGMPLYAAAALAVMASRIVLDAHFLSDVLAGAALALAACRAAGAGFERAGWALSDSP